MENNKQKAPLNMRALKGGSYSLVLCAAALILVIIINLFVNALPSTIVKIDASTLGTLNISDETKTVIASVKDPITLYLLAPRGNEDPTIFELLNRYADLNKNITVQTVDTDENPAFTAQFTTDTLSPNSVIVAGEKRFYIIDYYDIYVTSYENITEEELYNYYYYGIAPSGTPYFYGECELTSALDYVTAEKIPTVYMLTNHDEDALSDTMTTYFATENVILSTFTLLNNDGIPADCSAIFINNPKTDISTYEADLLLDYLQNGGNLILITDFRYCTVESMPNLLTVTEFMGMTVDEGIVVEGNANNYNGYPFYLLPVLSPTGPAADITSSVTTMLPNAHSIRLTGEGSATVSSFLKTTTASYLKKAGANLSTYEKEDGDTDGPCTIAASAQLTAANGESKMIWFSSPYIVNDEMDYYVNGSNSSLFMTGVTWMCEKVASVSVLAKLMQVEALMLSTAASTVWSTIITVILPLLIVGGGFVVWFKRTRK